MDNSYDERPEIEWEREQIMDELSYEALDREDERANEKHDAMETF